MGFILFVLVIGIAFIIIKSMSSTSNKNTWIRGQLSILHFSTNYKKTEGSYATL